MMKKIHKLLGRKGFTLVELIIVLTCLAILMAVLIPSLSGYIDKADQKAVISEAREVYKAAQTALSEVYAEDAAAVAAAADDYRAALPDFAGGSTVCGTINDRVFDLMQRRNVRGPGQVDQGSVARLLPTVAGKTGVQTLTYIDSPEPSGARYVFGAYCTPTSPAGKTLKQYFADNGDYTIKHDVTITVFFNASGEIVFLQFGKNGGKYIVYMTKDSAVAVEDGKGVTTDTIWANM